MGNILPCEISPGSEILQFYPMNIYPTTFYPATFNLLMQASTGLNDRQAGVKAWEGWQQIHKQAVGEGTGVRERVY